MKLYINQLGYLPESRKTAILAEASQKGETPLTQPPRLQLTNVLGECILEKCADFFGYDESSGDYVWQMDFSEVTEGGMYTLTCGNLSSYPFVIGTDLYDNLNVLLCKALYFQRCGIPMEPKYAGLFTRPVCHRQPSVLWDDYKKFLSGEIAQEDMETFDIKGGWHDAGDFGRYSTAAACALGHILYAYRFFPKAFQKNLNIPESGNGIPDILNECRYELDWLLQMQTEDGGVYHKQTTRNHADFIMPDRDTDPLILFPVSSMAVADFSAVMALASRTYSAFDPDFSDTALTAAKKSWKWLEQHPDYTGFKNPEGSNTGEYGDGSDTDERLWAAAELYRTTGETFYLDKARELYTDFPTDINFGWADMEGFAGWALLEDILLGKDRFTTKIPSYILSCRRAFVAAADRLLSTIHQSGYGVSLTKNDFVWGSNMVVLNNAMLLGTVHLLTGERQYLDGSVRQMDYILGVNAVDYSYITGVGAHAFEHPHNRITEADGIDDTIPGYVSGGPNGTPCDDVAIQEIPAGTPPMKCFVDRFECYSLNEITIYWNSPAIFTAAFLDSTTK